MLAEWLRERDRRKAEEMKQEGIVAGRQEGIVAGRQEGIAAGRQERDREWLAWYERLQAAQRDGRPFTEPPPVEPEDGNGA